MRIAFVLITLLVGACRTQPLSDDAAAAPSTDMAQVTCPDPRSCKMGGLACLRGSECCTGFCDVSGVCTSCRAVGETCLHPCECCFGGSICIGSPGICPLGP